MSEDPKLVLGLKEAWFNKGVTLQELGRHQEAIASYDQVLSLDPNDALAYNNRGFIYGERKEYDKALSDYNKAISLDQNYAMA